MSFNARHYSYDLDPRQYSESKNNEKAKEIAKNVISIVISVALATGVIIKPIVEHRINEQLPKLGRFVMGFFDSKLTLVIDRVESNQIYESAIVYLGTKTTQTRPHIEISDEKSTVKGVMEIGVHYTWKLKSEEKSLELKFDKKMKQQALNRYIPHVIEEAKRTTEERKSIKLYTLSEGREWRGLNLKHPSTFENIAMDLKEKERVIEDLERFVRRKEYYHRVGKAWKRGYLLYGPPGTGKSSLIAAMAKYLRFNVYDLDLGAMNSNSDLRSMLLGTENRSILVVEDIDCSVQMRNRLDDSSSSENNRPEKKVTLSGFMNFIDGLWSGCEDERIIIFTTNYKNKLDPALLRPGRMDVHIAMSYCTPNTFRMLARNYLGLESHRLFKETTKLIEQVKVTPAEVAEQLMKEDDPQVALEGVVGFLQEKKVRNEDEDEEDADE